MDTVVVVFIGGVMPREKNGRVYVQSIGMIKLAMVVNLTNIYMKYTRKMVPITGRASSFLVFLEFSKNSIYSRL